MHHPDIIAWPSLIPGEDWSPPEYGPWLAPAQVSALGYTPWCVLGEDGQPWSWGLAAPGPAVEVLAQYRFRVAATQLRELEQLLCRVLGARGWRNERFGLIGPHGVRATGAGGRHDPDLELSLERSLFRVLGLLSESVQLNLQAGEQVWWVARRALTKAVDPGLLDACVAGGLPARESPVMALLREAGEEAGLSIAQASRARLLGLVRVLQILPQGLLLERVWTYGMRAEAGAGAEVAAKWQPTPVDGEVSAFEQMTLGEIESAWRTGGFNHEAAVASLCFMRPKAPPPTR